MPGVVCGTNGAVAWGLTDHVFGSAALTWRVIGEEPLSEDMRRAHIDFLKRATHRLMGGA